MRGLHILIFVFVLIFTAGVIKHGYFNNFSADNFLNKTNQPQAVRIPFPFVGGYPGHIREDLVFLRDDNETLRPIMQGEDFVIAAHFRFNYTVLRNIMPKDTVFISIVREPWKNFQSAFHFYHTNARWSKTSFHTCFKYPYFDIAKGQTISLPKYLELVFDDLNESIPWYFRSKNYQSFDLGLDPLLDDADEINEAVQQLASQIDLMMITDYMDESLILLKELLCMSWTDIAHHYARQYPSYPKLILKSNKETMKKFNQFYKLDNALYNHFNNTFWEKVRAYGRKKMTKDVKTLRRYRARLMASSKTPPTTRTVATILQEKKLDKDFYNRRSNSSKLIFKTLQNNVKHSAGSCLTEKQTNQISEYMKLNKGGCPIQFNFSKHFN